MNFAQAFDRLIHHEGGFTDNDKDPGNWTGGKPGVGQLKGTKYGISAAQYPNLDIKGLTLDDAKGIYFRDYWSVCGCEHVPESLKFDLFDTAVNSGPGRAAKLLQRALGVKDDGVIGPKTREAIAAMEPGRLFSRFNGWRLDFLNDNPAAWAEFGRGWAQRIADNLKAA